MKTEITLTVEIEKGAELDSRIMPVPAFPTPAVVLNAVNAALREWAGENPFGLVEPDHLRLKLALREKGREADPAAGEKLRDAAEKVFGATEVVRKQAAILATRAEALCDLAKGAAHGC